MGLAASEVISTNRAPGGKHSMAQFGGGYPLRIRASKCGGPMERDPKDD